jgi:flagellar M-ring protein FliF
VAGAPSLPGAEGATEEDALVTLSGEAPALPGAASSSALNATLEAAKLVAKENPRMVANVVSNWTSAEK